MRLQAAARHADKMLCLDAYSGKPAFFGQLSLYDDTKRDSETGERRIISCGPEAIIPARRVVKAAGATFIMGHANPDSFRNRVIRVGYVAHEASELSAIRSLGQICRGEPGVSAWAGRVWVKNATDSQHSSQLAGQNHIYYAQTESVPQGHLVTFEGRLHVVRMSQIGPAGTLVAFCDQMPEPAVEMASIGTGTYDPVSGTRAPGTTSVRVVRVRWQSAFQYRNSAAPKFTADDIQVAVAKSAVTVTAGMPITLSDGLWQIQSPLDEGDVWLCRATRHA